MKPLVVSIACCVFALGFMTTPARADLPWSSSRFALPLLEQPSFVDPTWLPRLTIRPATAPLELPRVSPSATANTELATLMMRRPSLGYTPRDWALTLSLEPGAPCTGACLKLAGWF